MQLFIKNFWKKLKTFSTKEICFRCLISHEQVEFNFFSLWILFFIFFLQFLWAFANKII